MEKRTKTSWSDKICKYRVVILVLFVLLIVNFVVWMVLFWKLVFVRLPIHSSLRHTCSATLFRKTNGDRRPTRVCVCVLGGGILLTKDWVHADYIAAIVSRIIVIIVLDVEIALYDFIFVLLVFYYFIWDTHIKQYLQKHGISNPYDPEPPASGLLWLLSLRCFLLFLACWSRPPAFLSLLFATNQPIRKTEDGFV